MKLNRLNTILFLIVTLFTVPLSYAQSPVRVSGAMINIMKKGDLSAYVNLDTLKKENLYGLGAVAGLEGEIMIENGQVYTSTVTDGKIANATNKVSQAAMLVYTQVNQWQSIDTSATINNSAELEAFIEQIAKKNNQSLSEPFAFKIQAAASSVNYHVIDWQEGTAHTMSNHKQFAVSQSPENISVTLLGFYSDHHHSIFTHHSSNMHVHVKTQDQVVGHLDNLKINGPLTVFLAK